jgi:hypothetical protein
VTDRDRLLALLRARGDRGVTTFEIRRRGISGNPSQRKADLEELGYLITVKPYSEGKRHGCRYTLVSDPVGVGADGQSDGVSPAMPSEASPTVSPDPSESVKTGTGSLFDLDEYRPRPSHDSLDAA